jgi:hypothetical protein
MVATSGMKTLIPLRLHQLAISLHNNHPQQRKHNPENKLSYLLLLLLRPATKT